MWVKKGGSGNRWNVGRGSGQRSWLPKVTKPELEHRTGVGDETVLSQGRCGCWGQPGTLLQPQCGFGSQTVGGDPSSASYGLASLRVIGSATAQYGRLFSVRSHNQMARSPLGAGGCSVNGSCDRFNSFMGRTMMGPLSGRPGTG